MLASDCTCGGAWGGAGEGVGGRCVHHFADEGAERVVVLVVVVVVMGCVGVPLAE